jgi:hypothetical protein
VARAHWRPGRGRASRCLRSFATLAALVAFLAAAFLWLPDPGGHSSSLSWHEAGGRVVAPLYTSSYVGLAITLLGVVILTLFGFYLVAGSVRRDRERGVGAILAATPLSKTAYLCGKFAAHASYLFVVAALALPAGLLTFARWGEGPFVPVDFLGIYVLTLAPALLFVAAAAVLFDVAPGLSGRGGLVAWFFSSRVVRSRCRPSRPERRVRGSSSGGPPSTRRARRRSRSRSRSRSRAGRSSPRGSTSGTSPFRACRGTGSRSGRISSPRGRRKSFPSCRSSPCSLPTGFDPARL